MAVGREKFNATIDVKKLSALFTKIEKNHQDILVHLDRFLSRMPDVLIGDINQRFLPSVTEFIFTELFKLNKKLSANRLDLALKQLRKDALRQVTISRSFSTFITVWISLREVVVAMTPKWFAAASAKAIIRTGEAFWTLSLLEIMHTYLEYTDQVIREKTLESSVLFHTTQSITTELDLDSLLGKIVFHAGMLLKNKQIYLFVPEKNTNGPVQERKLVLRASNLMGEAYGEYSLRMGEGPIGKTAELCVARIDNHYSKSKKKLAFLSNAAHLLTVPIVFSEQLLGVLLAVGAKKNELFTHTEKELLLMYSQQIAVTFKNVMLYQEQSHVTRELEEKNQMLELQADLILRKSAQMTVLNEVTQKVNSSLELKEVLALLTRHAVDSIGVNRCIVWLFDDMKVTLDAVAASGLKEELLEKMRLPLDSIRDTAFFKTLAALTPQQIGADQEKIFFSEVLGDMLTVKTMLIVPLVFKEEAIGVLAVDDTREIHDFLDDEITLISAVANQTVMAIENARLYQKVKEQAITDALTGVYNHRFFQIRFTDEYAHSKRYGNDFSLIILDIDHFKHYNDTYGHVAGDLALKEIAALTGSSVRENDVVARYGGEEFAIILPMTNMEGALIVAERIRNSILECRFLGDLKVPQVSITVSMGISSYSEKLENREMMFKNADKALYTAKEKGRNQTICFQADILSKEADPPLQ
ncbi:diguanylate cyclase [bacterium]|nr:diguanylate cyclase [bacterium]